MKKEANFEINLLPIISLLAVCISFLLLTAVWIHVGSLNIAQAVGSSSDNKVQASLMLKVNKAGDVEISVKDADNIPKMIKAMKIDSYKNKISWKSLENQVDRIQKYIPELKIALILPEANTSYESMIQLVDMFKQRQIINVGIAPLAN